jgi:micrococcal nuclease
MRYTLHIAIILICVFTRLSFAGNYTVKKIYSGDRIMTQGGKKVKYVGMDPPGKGRFFYEECKKANEALVDKKEITIEFDVKKKDEDNDLIGYVYAGDVFVNAQLLKNGFAIVYIQPPNQKYADLFIALQKEARAHDRGIWAYEDPNDEP